VLDQIEQKKDEGTLDDPPTVEGEGGNKPLSFAKPLAKLFKNRNLNSDLEIARHKE